MTPRLRTLVAVVSLLLLTGCGGGAKKGTTPTSTPTKAPLTAAQAKAVLPAAILTAADLPGYTAEAATADPDKAAEEKKMYTCLGVPAPSYLAEDAGKSFSKDTSELSSSADVATSADIARTQAAGFAGDKAVDCFKKQIADGSKEDGITITTFTVTPAPATVAGSDAAFAYSFDLEGTSPDGPLKVQGIVAGAVVDQVMISMEAFGLGQLEITPAQVVTLLGKAADRTTAELAKLS